MPIESRWTCDIPNVSLTTFLFRSPDHPLPDTPCFIDADRPDTHYLTFKSYRLWCQRLAAGLQAAGLKNGDRVLMFSSNTFFTPVLIHGTIMAGGVFSGANPTFVARELAYQLSDSGALFLVSAESELETAREAAQIAGVSEDRIFLFDDGTATLAGNGRGNGNVRHWSALIADEATGSKFRWEELKTPEELNRTVALNYSSGTTGVPKGVMITHANYVANCTQTEYVSALDPEHEDKVKKAKTLCYLPMYHAMAQSIFAVSMPMRGIPVYIMSKFDFLKMLEYVQKYQITGLALVPPIAVALAKHPAVKDYDLSSVETLGCGAAPLGREVSIEVEQLWPEGKVNLKQGWGMTELTCTATGWHYQDRSDSASIGELMPNCRAKIVNVQNETEVSQGERGEIWIQSPTVMKGYWKKPEATRDTITKDGWLRTGDIAYIDQHGHLFIVDRIKELIKVKGNQVAPAELEAVLLDHPAIADVAVIGVTKGADEEYPRAYVVLKDNQSVTEQDVQSWLEKRVARHKRLTGGVKTLAAIPRNPSGKILRKVLREQAVAEQL